MTPSSTAGADAEPAVRAHHVTKSYGGVQALTDFTVTIARGETVALLGPNGAGKTTAVEILVGHRARTTGSVRVLGRDPQDQPRELRRQIGVMYQETSSYPELTVAEAVRLHARYYRTARPVDDVLADVGLLAQRNRRIARLSGGQQRRVDLALALIGDPSLLFLDEPTTGFDPQARRETWEVLAALRELGVATLLTTHAMDEAQHLADRVVILRAGSVIASGTIDELARGTTSPVIRFGLPAGTTLPPDLAALTVARVGRLEIPSSNPSAVLRRITDWAASAGVTLTNLSVQQPTLEDVYLAHLEAHHA